MKRTLFVGVLSLWLSTAAIARLSYSNTEPVVTETKSQLIIDLQDPYRNLPENDIFYPCLEILANELNINTYDLFALIYFETGGRMNPQISNPNSSAKGLLQFTDGSAQRLTDKKGQKLKSSSQLIKVYPSIKEQLEIPNKSNIYGGPVYQYLKMLSPFKSTNDLYMSVMYPPGRKDGKLPEHLRKLNAGIKTASDFVNLARRKAAQSGMIIKE